MLCVVATGPLRTERISVYSNSIEIYLPLYLHVRNFVYEQLLAESVANILRLCIQFRNILV